MQLIRLQLLKYSTSPLKPSMDLKQFMVRLEVLKLYRQLLQAVNKVDNPTYRQELHAWIRRDFRAQKGETNPDSINIYITYGKKCLNELETSIEMAK